MMPTINRLWVLAVAAAFLVSAASCGGSPQVSPPAPPGEAPPSSVALVSPAPAVSSTRPASISSTAPQGTGAPDGRSPSTAPSVVGSSTTLPSVSSTTLLASGVPGAPGVSVCCVSWSTEELAGFFVERLQSFKALSGPKYDTSTPLGALCWAWWEVKHAAAHETALEGRFSDEGRVDSGIAFTALREALVDRARRGDTEASQVLLDAADVRKPGEGYSLASVVEAVNAAGVRTVVLSVDDVELRSAAEALFVWVAEYERNPVAGETDLERGLVDVGSCQLPPVPELTAAEETLTIEEIRALTREEVENLTQEQLKDIDVNAAFENGRLLRDFPLDLQLAWGDKMYMKLTEYIRARCCYSLNVGELVERSTIFSESKKPFVDNENDPSTPLGAYCWSIWEVYRSYSLNKSEYFEETIFDLYVAELRARVEMGIVGAGDALRRVPAEAPLTEYPFVDALEAVNEPRVRETAFAAADSVLLEAVEVLYALVDEYRQEEAPSPYAFMGEFLPRIMPELAPSASSQHQADVQALKIFLKECKPPGNFVS